MASTPQRITSVHSKLGSVKKAGKGPRKFIDYLVDESKLGHEGCKMWQKNFNANGYKNNDISISNISEVVGVYGDRTEKLHPRTDVIFKTEIIKLSPLMEASEIEEVVKNLLKTEKDRRGVLVVLHKGSQTDPENIHLHVTYSPHHYVSRAHEAGAKEKMYADHREAVYSTMLKQGFVFREGAEQNSVHLRSEPYLKHELYRLAAEEKAHLMYSPDYLEMNFLPKLNKDLAQTKQQLASATTTEEQEKLTKKIKALNLGIRGATTFAGELRWNAAHPPKVTDKYTPLDFKVGYVRSPEKMMEDIRRKHPSQSKSSCFLSNTILPEIREPEYRRIINEEIVKITSEQIAKDKNSVRVRRMIVNSDVHRNFAAKLQKSTAVADQLYKSAQDKVISVSVEVVPIVEDVKPKTVESDIKSSEAESSVNDLFSGLNADFEPIQAPPIPPTTPIATEVPLQEWKTAEIEPDVQKLIDEVREGIRIRQQLESQAAVKEAAATTIAVKIEEIVNPPIFTVPIIEPIKENTPKIVVEPRKESRKDRIKDPRMDEIHAIKRKGLTLARSSEERREVMAQFNLDKAKVVKEVMRERSRLTPPPVTSKVNKLTIPSSKSLCSTDTDLQDALKLAGGKESNDKGRSR